MTPFAVTWLTAAAEIVGPANATATPSRPMKRGGTAPATAPGRGGVPTAAAPEGIDGRATAPAIPQTRMTGRMPGAQGNPPHAAGAYASIVSTRNNPGAVTFVPST